MKCGSILTGTNNLVMTTPGTRDTPNLSSLNVVTLDVATARTTPPGWPDFVLPWSPWSIHKKRATRKVESLVPVDQQAKLLLLATAVKLQETFGKHYQEEINKLAATDPRIVSALNDLTLTFTHLGWFDAAIKNPHVEDRWIAFQFTIKHNTRGLIYTKKWTEKQNANDIGWSEHGVLSDDVPYTDYTETLTALRTVISELPKKATSYHGIPESVGFS